MTSSRILKLFAAAGCALLLAGCVTTNGRDFATVPVATAIVPGTSTRADVIALLGEPQNQEVETWHKDWRNRPLSTPMIVTSLDYSFSSNDPRLRAEEDVHGRRYLNIVVVDGLVAGMRRTSSFKADSTNFDMARVSRIRKGLTTLPDVTDMLGKPSGVAVFPLASEPGGRIVYYTYSRLDLAANTKEFKSLTAEVGSDQRVIDFSVSHESEKLPVVHQPAPVIIPIYIPRSR